MEAKDYRDQMIFVISAPGWKFDVAYVVLDDFLLIGPGEPFLRHSVDVFLENHSLVDEYAFNALLPQTGQLNFSLLLYQDLTRSIPQIVNNFSRTRLTRWEQAMVPSMNIVERFQSAGISYAFSTDEYIDFYINGSSGVDFNMGGALPLVASLLTPRLFQGGFDSRFVTAQKQLKVTETALEAYYIDNNRYPDILQELISPVSYLSEAPKDYLSQNSRDPLQYIVTPSGDSYVLYSVGPDGKDGLGVVPYDPTNGTTSPGDMIIRKGK